MPINGNIILFKTKDWKEFEEMVCVCASLKWEMRFVNYGRSGQKQNGIDIISEDGKIAIQCKSCPDNKNAKRLISEITRDFRKITKLTQPIERFVVATALDADTHILECIQSLQNGAICIEVMFWDDICKIFADNPYLYKKYYPTLSTSKTRGQLFALAFFGVQIAKLIGLTLGDRSESKSYCSCLRNGALWIDDLKKRKEFLNYVENVEKFALGDLSVEDVMRYKLTDAYYWGENIQKIVIGLLDNLEPYNGDRDIYLAGYYLALFFCKGIEEVDSISDELEDDGISDELIEKIEDFVEVIKRLDIPSKYKDGISSLAFRMKEKGKVSDISGRIFDQLRLVII